MSHRPSLSHGVRGGIVALVVLLLYLTFRNVDLVPMLALVRRLGPSLPALLIPSLCAVAIETVAWQRTFALLGAEASFASLCRVRVATESVGNAVPLGMVWAEAAKPAMLSRHAALTPSTSLAGMAGRKYLLAVSQAAYLLIGFAIGGSALAAGFGRAFGMPALAKSGFVFALLLLVAAEAAAEGLRGGRALERALSLVGRIPSAALREALTRLKSGARTADRAMLDLFDRRHRTLLPLAVPCLASWLFEALETWTILRALGSPIGFGDAIGVETLVVLLRQILVFLPGGLGALEMGYATLLTAEGSPLELCTAFVLVKRLRELAWIAFGCALLAADRFAVADEAGRREPDSASSAAPVVT